MKKSLIAKIIISIAIIFILIYKIGLNSIISNLQTINLFFLPAIILMYIINFYTAGINLKVLTQAIGKKINIHTLTKYHIISWAMGLWVPGKIGEFSIIYLFKKKKISIGEGTVIHILDKAITILTFSIVSIVGFFIFYGIEKSLEISIILLIVFLIGFTFLISSKTREFLKKYILRKHHLLFKGFSKTLFLFLKKKKRFLLINILLTLMKLVFSSAIVWLIFLSTSTYVNIMYVIIFNSMLTIISLIPISLGGLGIREMSAVLLYKIIGINEATTLSIYIIVLIFNYIISISSIYLLKEKKIKTY